MVLEKAYIIPHGDEIISQPNDESRIMFETINEYTRKDKSDSIIIISPHSLRLNRSIPVINTEHLYGNYKIDKKVIRKSYSTNREINRLIISNCDNTEEVNFVTAEGKLSRFPVDFGSLIPLTFFNPKKVSILGQWRTNNRNALVEFGKCLARIVKESSYNISVIFSADQAHTHNPKGPYGYSEMARVYDDLVVETLKNNNFEKLKSIENEIIENAKPDSFWNMLTFSGFIEEASLKPIFRYYYVQEYFGMIFADTS